MSRYTETSRTAFALIVCLLGLALARAPLTIDAGAVPFADGPSEAAIGLAWHDGLVLVFGAGDLGTAKILDDDADNYETRGFDRINAAAALRQSGLVENVGSGVTFVHDCCHLHALERAYAARLLELGFEVTSLATRPTILVATRGEHTYRLVFNHADHESVRVYIGS
jgi:hypothetical protein